MWDERPIEARLEALTAAVMLLAAMLPEDRREGLLAELENEADFREQASSGRDVMEAQPAIQAEGALRDLHERIAELAERMAEARRMLTPPHVPED